MPLTIESPPSAPPGARGAAARIARSDQLVVGLVNNMPDGALAATEAQFGALLQAAAAAVPVCLRIAYLPELTRGPAGLEHLGAGRHWHIDALLRAGVDALIVTGMEPGAGALTDEPYWGRFSQLLQWAEQHTASSVWSCLAAHAAALSLDGIQRQRLEHKRFGVFEHSLLAGHPLLTG